MANLPRVVILTGAGISAESGLKTFRDSNGLWENHKIEDVATPEAFAGNPDLVYGFYNDRRAQLQLPNVKPNRAHEALASLESVFGNNVLLVTQNVDNLHERAGSKNIIHMHGKLLSSRCINSGRSHTWHSKFDASTPCPCCTPASAMRPDIVWFGEMPMYMDNIILALTKADIFLSIGTSGQVYPAAGFVQVAKDSGARTVELNLQPSDKCALFDESYLGRASMIVPQFIHSLIDEYALTQQNSLL
ncbi:Sir2 family NAD+-dependent deacetylase [Aestuariibacter sp. A3R04]|uniref:Sir2 family NAD+-dependent deacetylase n=1 Tax=Aestuariibacter sp. A3R04 TaxID=2841571 RepID=UPI001C08FA4C|nr:Sir2 family NAD+-dependent deacetylase [Aestuariibacter sp. A3R04]MBU3022837.1 NAD-dependent protein deacylase [Aestuariibacter sp. A3R04]